MTLVFDEMPAEFFELIWNAADSGAVKIEKAWRNNSNVYSSADPRWSIVEFLLAICEGRYKVPFFPEEFSAAPQVFDKHRTPDEMRRYLAEKFPNMREV